ncbi:MAG: SDR family NAD(P)-dependent oxidoreductase [Phycisphaerae bacterium]|jgi:hypothetical protein
MAGSGFWHGRNVFVTGASSGLGWALAEHLAGRGAHLGLTARRGERLAELADRCRARGVRAAFAAADIRDPRQAAAALAALRGELGVCHVLIANAGVHRPTDGHEFNVDDALDVFATNVSGVIATIGAVLPEMVARNEGRIAVVASMAAMLGLPGVGAYCASKAALVTFMESLRIDLLDTAVKMTTVCPGFVDTPLIANHDPRILKFLLSAPDAAARIAQAIERGRTEAWFPWPMWALARFGRALPLRWYYAIVRGQRRRGTTRPEIGSERD